MKVYKENDEYAWVDWREDGESKSKLRKYLVIGGPLNGTFQSSVQVNVNEYVPFNCGVGRSIGTRGNKRKFSAVWLHVSLFNNKPIGPTR